MSGTAGSRRTQSTKTTPRLRAACNACNSAKTKCSGERTGCNRCQSLELECVYAESRVGKVPGVRAKRNTRVSADINDNSINDLFPELRSPHRSEPPPASTPTAFDVLDWSAELNDPCHQALEDALRTFNDNGTTTLFTEMQQNNPIMTSAPSSNYSSSSTSGPSFSSRSSDMPMPNLDFNISESRSQSSLGNRNMVSSSRSTMGVSPQPPRIYTEREINSQCVTACSQMITSLENYIADQLKALDLILGIVKRAVDTLNPLVGQQLGPRNLKCLALFGVMMYQIIELVEAGCAKFLEEQPEDFSMPNLSPTNGLGRLGVGGAGLGFGAFHFNHEEQKMWRSQIVLKELLLISELLRKIMALANTGPRGQDTVSSASEREGCYHDLEGRLKVVIEKVRGRAGMG